MRVLVQNTLTNRQWVGFDGVAGFLIGRDAGCDVQLDSRFVADVHARVERNDGMWEVELLPGDRLPNLRGDGDRAAFMRAKDTLAVVVPPP